MGLSRRVRLEGFFCWELGSGHSDRNGMGGGVGAGISFGFGFALTTLEEPSLGLGVILLPDARVSESWALPPSRTPTSISPN